MISCLTAVSEFTLSEETETDVNHADNQVIAYFIAYVASPFLLL